MTSPVDNERSHTRLHALGAKVLRFIESPIVIAVTLIISLASFGIAIKANMTATTEANERAKTSQQASDHLRATFCDLIQPLAIVPPANPQSTLGQTIREQSARSAAELQCSPDPQDHR